MLPALFALALLARSCYVPAMDDTTWTLVLAGYSLVLGLSVGSFLNVVIYRVPRELSVIRPRSFCPNCDRQLTPLENVPVVSYLVLRGKCRTCTTPISARYPIIEAVTAVLFVGASCEFAHDPRLPAIWIFVGGALALGIIDVDTMRLPTPLVRWHFGLVAFALLIAAIGTRSLHHALVALGCMVFWGGSFALVAIVAPGKLGGGDVRFAYVLGLMTGAFGAGTMLVGYFAASFLGLVVSLILIATGKMSTKQPLPFGCYLAAGATIAIFLSPLLPARFQL